MTKYTKPSWLRAANAARPKWVQDLDDKPKHKTMLHENSKTGLYESRRWRSVRKGYLMKHPLCEKCQAIGITTAANVLDHVIPIRQGGAVWDKDNWMGLCDECHNIKRGKEKHGKVIKSKENKNGDLVPVDRHAGM